MWAAIWPALMPVVQALFTALLPLIWKALNAPDTQEDGQSDTALRDRLLQRLRGRP